MTKNIFCIQTEKLIPTVHSTDCAHPQFKELDETELQVGKAHMGTLHNLD